MQGQIDLAFGFFGFLGFLGFSGLVWSDADVSFVLPGTRVTFRCIRENLAGARGFGVTRLFDRIVF